MTEMEGLGTVAVEGRGSCVHWGDVRANRLENR